MTVMIRLEAEFNEYVGRTILYDANTGIILFTATEAAAEWLQDPCNLAIAIATAIPTELEAEEEHDA